ncbi:phosphate/phosphite/phosphonate ABC transporter substrate-binding protein [Algirhabdus cladophorae]|uniref:phosphate/phosphite/phosphonate ABC transporter substrate-binding protein n=1 Tax=Algirhabdus cladophorae TaxID=3377108 RepID=UPI003B846DD1
MSYVASLPMYARPELKVAHDTFWALVREALLDIYPGVPLDLNQDGLGYQFWLRPDLILSQTCGYPYRTRLRDHVQLVGTPDYGLSDCPAGHYYSVFVVRQDSEFLTLNDLQSARMAYNDDQSQSGYHGPLAFLDHSGVRIRLGPESGAHRKSAQLVAQSLADVAALDAVTWAHMQRYDAVAQNLRVIGRTHSVPGLPLICAKELDAARVTQSVQHALLALGPIHKAALGITSIVPLGQNAYQPSAFDVN